MKAQGHFTDEAVRSAEHAVEEANQELLEATYSWMVTEVHSLAEEVIGIVKDFDEKDQEHYVMLAISEFLSHINYASEKLPFEKLPNLSMSDLR